MKPSISDGVVVKVATNDYLPASWKCFTIKALLRNEGFLSTFLDLNRKHSYIFLCFHCSIGCVVWSVFLGLTDCWIMDLIKLNLSFIYLHVGLLRLCLLKKCKHIWKRISSYVRLLSYESLISCQTIVNHHLKIKFSEA